MTEDFLGQFLGNEARARILRVFLFSPSELFSIASAAKRAGVSTASAEKEMKALEQLDVVKKSKVSITLANRTTRKVEGKQKGLFWTLNPDFKYTRSLTLFVQEVAPMQYKSIVEVLKRSGKITVIILSGSFMGDPTRPADIIVVGDPLHEKRLGEAMRVLEPRFGREIRYASFSTPEFRYRLTIQDKLVRDTVDYPHLVLLDKERLL